MAILILVIGTLMFVFGIAGQVALTRRRVQAANEGDKRSRRIVVTLAALIIGAWLIIAAIVFLLHSHAHAIGR